MLEVMVKENLFNADSLLKSSPEKVSNFREVWNNAIYVYDAYKDDTCKFMKRAK
jgi:hypothetical protein